MIRLARFQSLSLSRTNNRSSSLIFVRGRKQNYSLLSAKNVNVSLNCSSSTMRWRDNQRTMTFPSQSDRRAFCTTPGSANTASTTNRSPQQEILEAALKHVSKHGWSNEALSEAAAEMGYPASSIGMFDRGPVELVEYFVDKANREWIDKLSSVDLTSMNTKEAMKTAMRLRLEQNIPYLSRWPQALSLLSSPQSVFTSLHRLGALIDEICARTGDRSADFDWYTKRVTLTGIYAATELYMLTDGSMNYRDTWSFLDRRFDDYESLTQARVQVESVGSLVLGGARSVVSSAFASPSSTTGGASNVLPSNPAEAVASFGKVLQAGFSAIPFATSVASSVFQSILQRNSPSSSSSSSTSSTNSTTTTATSPPLDPIPTSSAAASPITNLSEGAPNVAAVPNDAVGATPGTVIPPVITPSTPTATTPPMGVVGSAAEIQEPYAPPTISLSDLPPPPRQL